MTRRRPDERGQHRAGPVKSRAPSAVLRAGSRPPRTALTSLNDGLAIGWPGPAPVSKASWMSSRRSLRVRRRRKPWSQAIVLSTTYRKTPGPEPWGWPLSGQQGGRRAAAAGRRYLCHGHSPEQHVRAARRLFPRPGQQPDAGRVGHRPRPVQLLRRPQPFQQHQTRLVPSGGGQVLLLGLLDGLAGGAVDNPHGQPQST